MTKLQNIKGDRVKRFRIRYSVMHFAAFELNTERYRGSLRIQSKCGKILTRITPNTDTFHTVEGIDEMLSKVIL